MFFAKDKGSEKLAIFGTRRARRGAELKVMSAVEHKHPGYFLSSEGKLRDPLKQARRNAPPSPLKQQLPVITVSGPLVSWPLPQSPLSSLSEATVRLKRLGNRS